MGKQIYLSDEQVIQLKVLIDNVLTNSDLTETQEKLYENLLGKLEK